jgi:pseudouridine-5'-phosphate glycosidase
MTMPRLMTDEVQDAMHRGVPLVALETTLVSHGFPGGEGVQVALAAEARVREAGAVPATIGLVDGALRVGLTESDLKRFASAGVAARKVGARDLAACLEQGVLGATTVGGTLAVCRLAGIRFMATGGTGGVHRGFASVPDVSADLPQIARTQALVVRRQIHPGRGGHRGTAGDPRRPGARLAHPHAPDVLQRRGRPTSVRCGHRRRGGCSRHRDSLAP